MAKRRRRRGRRRGRSRSRRRKNRRRGRRRRRRSGGRYNVASNIWQTLAGGDTAPYVGHSDLAMMPSVAGAYTRPHFSST